MRGKKVISAIASIFLIFGLSLCIGNNVRASDADIEHGGRTLRFGIIEYPGYCYRDSSGNVDGVDVEYAYMIAQTANYNAEITVFDSPLKACEAIDNGDIDVLCELNKTEAYSKKYLYAEHENISVPCCIYVTTGGENISGDDYSRLEKYIYGAVEGSDASDKYVAWCAKHDFVPKIVKFHNRSGINAALDAGKIDAGITDYGNMEGYRTVETFGTDSYFMVFSRSNHGIKNIVDAAIDSIAGTDPLYYQKLVKKYQSQNTREMELLTRGERVYIRKHGSRITVAVLKNDRPYYYKKSNGTPGGIIPDFYRNITEKTGMQFTYTEYADQDEAVDAVRKGKEDILGMYSNGLIYAHDSGLRITQPYSTTNAVMITKAGADQNDIRKIAVKNRNMLLIGNSLYEYKNAKYVNGASADECFSYLKHGKVDAVICGLPSATYLVNRTNSAAYHLNTLSSLSIDICGATAYENSTLCHILDKAIIVCGYSFDSIMADNTNADTNLITTIARVSPVTLILIGTLLMLMVFGLIISNVMLIRRQREKNFVMAEKEETDREKIRIEAIEKNADEKNRFFSNISHDMRTPLNAIIGFANIAEKEELTPRAADCVRKIQGSGKLLLDLINDTLTVSKMNSGKLTLNLQPVQIGDILDEVILSVNTIAKAKNIIFDIDRSGLVERVVVADKLNVEKVMLNLLTNAVKYTQEGGHVWLALRDEYNGGEYPETVIIVKDNGIGISKEFIAHIYEPFSQEEDHGTNGTGLGLSIVRQLIDMMSGKIEVASEKGIGTTFTVRFVFQTVSADTVLRKEQHVPKDNRLLEGKKILLCEDNELNTEIARTLLMDKNMTVVCAENGQKGVDIFASSDINEYDAVLMDIHMPVMDGYTATEEIRKMKRTDAVTVPIIAMTADAFSDDVQKAHDAGMNDHIAKPVDPERVYKLLIKYACIEVCESPEKDI